MKRNESALSRPAQTAADIFWAITLALVAAVATPSVQAQEAVDAGTTLKQLQTIADDFMIAWQKQDREALASFLAPEFIFAGPGGYRNRTTTLNGLSHCKLGAYTLEGFEMRQTSADSAALLYKIHRDLVCGGEKELANTINADTFVRRDGKWTMVMTTEIVADGNQKDQRHIDK